MHEIATRNKTARRDKHVSQARTSRMGRTAASRRASRHSSRRPLRGGSADAGACGAPMARRIASIAGLSALREHHKDVSHTATEAKSANSLRPISGRFNPTSMHHHAKEGAFFFYKLWEKLRKDLPNIEIPDLQADIPKLRFRKLKLLKRK